MYIYYLNFVLFLYLFDLYLDLCHLASIANQFNCFIQFTIFSCYWNLGIIIFNLFGHNRRHRNSWLLSLLIFNQIVLILYIINLKYGE